MNGTTAYALSKQYVADTADQLGSLKGAPCTIKSITEVDGGQKVTFEWIGTSGTKQTSEMTVKNGVSVTGISDKGNGVFTLLFSDGSESDSIQTIKGEKGDKGDKLTFNDLSDEEKASLKGDVGFSPTITENADNTDKIYKLDIETVDGKFTTPNLKGADGQGGSGGTIDAPINSISVNGVNVLPDENKNVDITVPEAYDDTELLDIRVKADGTTATSAGNAVREQFNELKSEIDQLKQDGTGSGSGVTVAQSNSLWAIIQKAAFTEVLTDEELNDFKTAWGITTENIPATGITLDKSTLSFTDSATQTLVATVEPSDTTDKVVWTSNAESVATVANGVVTPIGNGSCTITATAGNYSANCEVIVSVESEIVTYTITNNLTNVSTDNPVTTVNENSGYTANLTADTGYTIDSVTVTMGGVDITAIAYSKGVITIGSTTGNIVVTASAKQSGSTEEITILKSITGDGNSYIDTEFIPTDGVKYQIGLRLNSDIDTSVKQYLWGADQYTSNEPGSYNQLVMYTQNSDYAKYGSWFFLDRGAFPQFILLAKSTDFTTQPGYFQCMSNENTISQQLYIDEDYTTAPPQGQWDKSVTYTGNKVYPIIPIYLFWVNRASGAFENERTHAKQKYTLYHFRIYDIVTDSLLHEFLPAKQGTKIGVYDTVTQKFHENKGTGTFGYEEVSA